MWGKIMIPMYRLWLCGLWSVATVVRARWIGISNKGATWQSLSASYSPCFVFLNRDKYRICHEGEIQSIFCELQIWPLQWRHNERHGISNHRRLECLLNRLFRCRSKKASKPRVTGLCEGNSPVAGEIPAQRASNAEMYHLMTSSLVLTIVLCFSLFNCA